MKPCDVCGALMDLVLRRSYAEVWECLGCKRIVVRKVIRWS